MYDVAASGKKHDLPEPQDRYLDRELSWLAFNERVLTMADDPETPLLERVNFLSIFASNLDEFFMVRVAGLKRRIATGLAVPSVTGAQPRAVMRSINKHSRALAKRHTRLFLDDIKPKLADQGIHFVSMDELTAREHKRIDRFYRERVFPVLTPLAVDPAHPFPYISGLSLNLGILLRHPATGSESFARLKVPGLLPRFINVSESPDGNRVVSPEHPARFVAVEDLIATKLDTLFEGMEIVGYSLFRVTRNEDMEVEEDEAENLLKALEKELSRRRFGPPVRLEVTHDIHPRVRALLQEELDLADTEIIELDGPLDLTGLSVIADIPRDDLHFPRTVPRMNRDLAPTETADQVDVFEATAEREILLHHPYDSFSTSVQAFIEQAAADPHVLAIKQTLYRTSGDSPIVDALIEAAHDGKQVLAVVEIKARFDEEANISWARKLERAGVHVVYGLVGLKTHAKLCLVVRQESDGLVRYSHVGTGNYHPKTARGYEDFGLLSRDPVLGEDISKLFNKLSGYSPRSDYQRLVVAPQSVRTSLLHLINRETENARAGKPARVRIKVNSIVDEAIIDALYLASRAGVQCQMFVRGICAIRPGIKGLSENIEVRSVLGRYLEHSRVFSFLNDGNTEMWIGSADLMHRNLDRRVEALVELKSAEHIAKIDALFDRAFDPATESFVLGPAGVWRHIDRSSDGEKLANYQELTIADYRRRPGERP